MKRSIRIIVVLCILLLCAGGAVYVYSHRSSPNVASSTSPQKTVHNAKPKASPTLDERVEEKLQSMSLAEKVGQLVMIGVHGTDLTDDSRYMLRQYHIGNVIYFDRNMQSQNQLRNFSQALQAYAQGEAGQKVPLFIATDEEGGAVARGKGILFTPPSEAQIGKTGRPQEAQDNAARVAQSLKSVGINVNLAPVVDLGLGDGRSFGTNPEQVAQFAKAAVTGYEQQGILCALKHFPGIGKGTVDSHQDVSTIQAPWTTLEKEDLVPFQTVIETQKAKPNDFLVLVSHLVYPALDKDHPASQSSAIMNGLLRQKLGFQGIIITDDMEMGAVAKHDGFRQLGVQAIKAGADIVMICHEYAHETDIYLGILDAVQSGDISESRIDDSVRRVLRAKLAHE